MKEKRGIARDISFIVTGSTMAVILFARVGPL